jgi:thiol-disulfide isomerase/thioredoxin
MKNFIIICCITLLVGCSSSTPQNSNSYASNSIQSSSIYIDLNNNEVDLSSFRGKKILINYWATWCGSCIQEMPSLLKAQELLKDENYIFLLVSDESIQKISRFKNRKKFNFTYLKSSVSLGYMGIYSLPTTYIFNEKGEKVKKIVGAVDWNSNRMIKKLKSL